MSLAIPSLSVQEMRLLHKKLFREGSVEVLYSGDGLTVYLRKLESQEALVIVNVHNKAQEFAIKVEANTSFYSSLSGGVINSDATGLLSLKVDGLATDIYLN